MERILKLIKEECNFQSTPRFVRQLHGGDINEVYLIAADEEFLVVKQNDATQFPQMLEKEFRAMQFLHEKSPLSTPKMHHHFAKEDQQFLVMKYIEEAQNSLEAQHKLGQGLAQQHQISNPTFGWTEYNYIGSLKQINTLKDNWNDFFVENRLLFQTKMAFDAGLLTTKDLQQMERLFQRLNEIIPEEKPALLHGDLWGGNYFVSTQNEPILYDPAIYFGHREMDIAMTKLFGGFSNEFYSAYEEENPLEKDWEKRIGLFQLYPNLVHLNLFGATYAESVRSALKRY